MIRFFFNFSKLFEVIIYLNCIIQMFIFEKNIKIHLQLIDVILEYLNTGYRWENNYSLSVNIPISINISLKPIYEVYYL